MTTTGSAHVLIVDDDRAQREILSRALKGAGYHTDSASEGRAALNLSAQQRYDVACLDYQMPGLNGIDLFSLLRERQPWLRAVLITAYGSIETVYPAMDVGMTRVLPKPVDVSELLNVVSAVLAHEDVDAASDNEHPK